MSRDEQIDEFMGWLFRDGGEEPPRREYDAVRQRVALLADPPESGPALRFGQEVILDCGPTWGGERAFIVGWVERTESLSVSGQFVHSGASREYVLQDALDAPNEEAVAAVYATDDPS